MSINEGIKWDPDNFKLETSSLWSFPSRGSWATHNANWRGNWSPYVPRNIILRYSKEGDLILDQFVGGGTTLVEAKLLNRNIIGIDINLSAINESKAKVAFHLDRPTGTVYLRKGDARAMAFIPAESIDLICTHPPYANIIRYSDDTPGDLSNCSVSDFMIEMKKVASECYRVLKANKYCAILMGDIRSKGCIIPISFEVMKLFEEMGFFIKEIIIKQQHNCKSTRHWESLSTRRNFLLLSHEYLFVFKK